MVPAKKSLTTLLAFANALFHTSRGEKSNFALSLSIPACAFAMVLAKKSLTTLLAFANALFHSSLGEKSKAAASLSVAACAFDTKPL